MILAHCAPVRLDLSLPHFGLTEHADCVDWEINLLIFSSSSTFHASLCSRRLELSRDICFDLCFNLVLLQMPKCFRVRSWRTHLEQV